MDLQSRKLSFIEDFIRLTNEEIIEKLEKLLKQERTKAFEQSLKPMTHEELEQRLADAEEDIKNGRVYTTEEAKALTKKRFSQRNL